MSDQSGTHLAKERRKMGESREIEEKQWSGQNNEDGGRETERRRRRRLKAGRWKVLSIL